MSHYSGSHHERSKLMGRTPNKEHTFQKNFQNKGYAAIAEKKSTGWMSEYKEGPIKKYELICNEILRCLKLYGNTVVSDKHMRKSIKLAWDHLYKTELPKSKQLSIDDQERYAKCVSFLEDILSKETNKDLVIRFVSNNQSTGARYFGGMVAPSFLLRPSVNNNNGGVPDEAVVSPFWIIERRTKNYVTDDMKALKQL